MSLTTFDVFLSYRHSDATVVAQVRGALNRMRIRYFIDEHLRVGTDWSDALRDAIMAAPAIAVLIGKGDIDGVQDREAKLALDRQTKEKAQGRTLPVIPVILPGAQPSESLPFINQNSWVNFANGFHENELDRLYFGITGRHRELPSSSSEVAPQEDPVEKAIGTLSPRLLKGDVSFIVGSGVSRPPSIADLARGLTARLRKKDPTLPDIPMLDLAASCYAVDNIGDNLAVEDGLREIADEHGSAAAQPVHSALARLALAVTTRARESSERGGGMQARRAVRDRTRADPKRRPLTIVTTNYDLLLEQALLIEGVSFLRFVQHAAQAIEVNDCDAADLGDVSQRAVNGTERIIGECPHRGFASGLRDLPTTHESGEQPDVILYKILGSRDVSGSCFISADQHSLLIHESLKQGGLPVDITSTVRNSRLVFLGYSLFDPVLRLLQHSLLIDRQSVPSYAIKRRPSITEPTLDCRVETGLWSGVSVAWRDRFRALLLEVDEREFLERLTNQVLMSGTASGALS